MYESISKNNELENEMSLDMSYFWYSDAASNQHRVVETQSSLMSVDLQQPGHRRPLGYLIWHNS